MDWIVSVSKSYAVYDGVGSREQEGTLKNFSRLQRIYTNCKLATTSHWPSCSDSNGLLSLSSFAAITCYPCWRETPSHSSSILTANLPFNCWSTAMKKSRPRSWFLHYRYRLYFPNAALQAFYSWSSPVPHRNSGNLRKASLMSRFFWLSRSPPPFLEGWPLYGPMLW